MKILNFKNNISAIASSWSLAGMYFETIEERHENMLLHIKKYYEVPDEEVLSEEIYTILYAFTE